MRCWESPGDLPLVMEIFFSFRSFRCAPLAKRHKISITRGRSPGLSQESISLSPGIVVDTIISVSMSLATFSNFFNK
jgi:hypothetical protein